MADFQQMGQSQVVGRELFSLYLPDLSRIPDKWPLPPKYFLGFLATDATSVEMSCLIELSEALLHAGCVYFYAWGPDCKRVHDIFDEVCFEIRPVVMTTWDSNASLDEALWSFLFSSQPDDGYLAGTGSILAVTVGHLEWDERIRSRLSDVASLKRDMMRVA